MKKLIAFTRTLLTISATLTLHPLHATAWAPAKKCQSVALNLLTPPEGLSAMSEIYREGGEITFNDPSQKGTYAKTPEKIEMSRSLISTDGKMTSQSVVMEIQNKRIQKMTQNLGSQKIVSLLNEDCQLVSTIKANSELTYDRSLCLELSQVVKKSGLSDKTAKECLTLNDSFEKVVQKRRAELANSTTDKLSLGVPLGNINGLPYQALIDCARQFEFEKKYDKFDQKAVEYSMEWLQKTFASEDSTSSPSAPAKAIGTK